MSKVRTSIDNYQVRAIVRAALINFIGKAMEAPSRTKKKPWGIECDDWHTAFNTWPWGSLFGNVIPEYRSFRFYKKKSSRDRALIDLKKKYKYKCKFRIPPREAWYISSEKRIIETESKFCNFLRKCFGEKK